MRSKFDTASDVSLEKSGSKNYIEIAAGFRRSMKHLAILDGPKPPRS